MRIVQVVFPSATTFEQKCQRIDYASLREHHEVEVVQKPENAGPADVVHFYSSRNIVNPAFRGIKAPIVCSGGLSGRRRAESPPLQVSPIEEPGFTLLPEAVEDIWFETQPQIANRERRIVASLARPTLRSIVEQTVARIHRTREDVEWLVFDTPPSANDLAGIDVWVDPAIDAHDFDGLVAEAVVSGVTTVASRTPINSGRLEKGRTGWLVPPDDPNELAHAILSALFKPEVAQQKIEAARQTASKFRPRQRARVLTQIYESLRS